MFTKEQAYLIMILFKTQNFERLVSDFVEVDNKYNNLKIGDLTILDDCGAIWLEKIDWHFRIIYEDISNTEESRFVGCGGLSQKIIKFDFFKHISFEDKV